MESVITVWYLMMFALKVKWAKLHTFFSWGQTAKDQIVTLIYYVLGYQQVTISPWFSLSENLEIVTTS